MRLSIAADADWESRVERVLIELRRSKLEEVFTPRSYGRGVVDFGIVVMCRRPGVEFHRRRRYQAGPAHFGIDVFVPFEAMRDATTEGRRRILAEGVCRDIQTVFAERKTPIPEFEVHAFLEDLREEFVRIGWLEKPQAERGTKRPRASKVRRR